MSLSDSQTTGLNVASTQSVVFSSAGPPDPSGQTATVNSSTQITLDWTSGGGSTADYIIAYSSGASPPADCTLGTVIPAAAVTGTSNAVTGLTPSTQYSFRICAIDANGTPNVSAGVTATGTTSANDGVAPGAPAAMNIESGGLSLTPSWSASTTGATGKGYLLIRRAGSAVTWTPTATATYTAGQNIDGGTHEVIYAGSELNAEDAPLTVGTTYYYSVYAYDVEKDYSVARTASRLLKKHIYRSVQVGATSALATGSSNALNVTGSIATFATGLSASIGVGDALEYDYSNSGSINKIVFISRRISSTQYYVHTAAAATPTATTADDNDWRILRAYTSLYDAERGSENSGLTAGVANFDTFTTGRDLVTNDEIWHIALYGSNIPDTVATTITGWTTGANNYLKVYTPMKISEVGISQRHRSVWNEYLYRLAARLPTTGAVLEIKTGYVRIEGIQLYLAGDPDDGSYGIWTNFNGAQDIYITDSIIRGPAHSSQNWIGLIKIYVNPGGSESGNVKLKNNIIYDAITTNTEGTCVAIFANLNVYVYNNTIYNFKWGIAQSSGTAVAINNIVEASSDGYVGTFNASSNYNVSNLAGDAPGANSKQSSTASYVSAANRNLNIASGDTVAKDSGTNLSGNASLSFNSDNLGNTRTGTWDIGAGEVNSTAVAPVVFKQIIEVNTYTARNITLTGIDTNWEALSYSVVANPSHGTLDISNLPIVIYTPDNAYTGSDAFTFKASDGILDSNTATINITVGSYYHRIIRSEIALSKLADGLNELDADCQSQAATYGLGGGKWKVVASSETVNAKDHISIYFPVKTLLGDAIANDADDLWDGTITTGIKYDMSGTTLDWDVYSTGSDFDGTKLVGHTCNNWNSKAAVGHYIGTSHWTDGKWISENAGDCSFSLFFLCIDRQ